MQLFNFVIRGEFAICATSIASQSQSCEIAVFRIEYDVLAYIVHRTPYIPRKWKIVRVVRWNCSTTVTGLAAHRMWSLRIWQDFCTAMSVAMLKCALESNRPVWLQDKICAEEKNQKEKSSIWILWNGERHQQLKCIYYYVYRLQFQFNLSYLESPFGWHACKMAGRASSSNTSTVRTPAFRTVTSIVK